MNEFEDKKYEVIIYIYITRKKVSLKMIKNSRLGETANPSK